MKNKLLSLILAFTCSFAFSAFSVANAAIDLSEPNNKEVVVSSQKTDEASSSTSEVTTKNKKKTEAPRFWIYALLGTTIGATLLGGSTFGLLVSNKDGVKQDLNNLYNNAPDNAKEDLKKIFNINNKDEYAEFVYSQYKVAYPVVGALIGGTVGLIGGTIVWGIKKAHHSFTN